MPAIVDSSSRMHRLASSRALKLGLLAGGAVVWWMLGSGHDQAHADTPDEHPDRPVAAQHADPLGSLTKTVHGTSKALGATVNDTTGNVAKSVDHTAHTATKTVDKTVRATTRTVDHTVHATTKTVDHTVHATIGNVDKTVHTATKTVDHTVRTATKTVDHTVRTATKTVDKTVRATTKTVDHTVRATTKTVDDTVKATTGAVDKTTHDVSKSVHDTVAPPTRHETAPADHSNASPARPAQAQPRAPAPAPRAPRHTTTHVSTLQFSTATTAWVSDHTPRADQHAARLAPVDSNGPGAPVPSSPSPIPWVPAGAPAGTSSVGSAQHDNVTAYASAKATTHSSTFASPFRRDDAWALLTRANRVKVWPG